MAKKTTTQKPYENVNSVLDKISSFKKFRYSKTFYIILILVGILLLAVFKKSWFIAAMVNGSPITNLELQMKLNKEFRSQTLNQMIDEKIIEEQAKKANALPSKTEADQKIAEIETQVGGKETLDSLLSQQGQTRESLVKRVSLQLAIAKLYDKEASVSGEEIASFIEANKDQLQASDSAGQEKEALDNLKNQKLSQIFSQKFQELKTAAKIQIF